MDFGGTRQTSATANNKETNANVKYTLQTNKLNQSFMDLCIEYNPSSGDISYIWYNRVKEIHPS